MNDRANYYQTLHADALARIENLKSQVQTRDQINAQLRQQVADLLAELGKADEAFRVITETPVQ